MLRKNVYFTDMYLDEQKRLIFTPSKIPTKEELDGEDIINSINFNDDEEDR